MNTTKAVDRMSNSNEEKQNALRFGFCVFHIDLFSRACFFLSTFSFSLSLSQIFVNNQTPDV